MPGSWMPGMSRTAAERLVHVVDDDDCDIRSGD
jgi:hypothetical protein